MSVNGSTNVPYLSVARKLDPKRDRNPLGFIPIPPRIPTSPTNQREFHDYIENGRGLNADKKFNCFKDTFWGERATREEVDRFVDMASLTLGLRSSDDPQELKERVFANLQSLQTDRGILAVTANILNRFSSVEGRALLSHLIDRLGKQSPLSKDILHGVISSAIILAAPFQDDTAFNFMESIFGVTTSSLEEAQVLQEEYPKAKADIARLEREISVLKEKIADYEFHSGEGLLSTRLMERNRAEIEDRSELIAAKQDRLDRLVNEPLMQQIVDTKKLALSMLGTLDYQVVGIEADAVEAVKDFYKKNIYSIG